MNPKTKELIEKHMYGIIDQKTLNIQKKLQDEEEWKLKKDEFCDWFVKTFSEFHINDKRDKK